MDRDGIDICIIHPIDFGLADRCSEPVVPYQLQNETMWNIARKYEGRMYCSVSVDPAERTQWRCWSGAWPDSARLP